MVKEAGIFEIDELLLPYIDYAGVARDKRQAAMTDSGFISEGLLARSGQSMSIRNIRESLPIRLKKTGYPVKRSVFTIR